MTSAREKFFFTRTLCCLLKSLEGLQAELELRNDAHLKGIVERVESSMGVTMVNCELIVGGRMRKLQQMFVQGRKIRMVAIPDHVDMISAMLNVISMFDSSRIKGRNEFKKQPRVRGRGSSVRSRGVRGKSDALSRGRARGKQEDVHVDIAARGRGYARPALNKSSVVDSYITPQVNLHVSVERDWTKSIQQTDSCSGNERDTTYHNKTSERVFALGESNNSNINVQSRLLKLSGSMESPIVPQAKQTESSSKVKRNLLQPSGSDSRPSCSSFRAYKDSHREKTDRKKPQKKEKHSFDRDKSGETERCMKDSLTKHDEREKNVPTEKKRSKRHSDREESVPTEERRSERHSDREKSVPTEERKLKRHCDTGREESVPTKERSKRHSDREKSVPTEEGRSKRSSDREESVPAKERRSKRHTDREKSVPTKEGRPKGYSDGEKSVPTEERRSKKHSDKEKSSLAEKEDRSQRHGSQKKSSEMNESRLTRVSMTHQEEELLKSSIHSERYSRFQGVVQQESSSRTGLRHDDRYHANPTIFHSSTRIRHRQISPTVSLSEHSNANRHAEVEQPESIRPSSKTVRQRLNVQDLRELIAHRRSHRHSDDDQDDN